MFGDAHSPTCQQPQPLLGRQVGGAACLSELLPSPAIIPHATKSIPTIAWLCGSLVQTNTFPITLGAVGGGGRRRRRVPACLGWERQGRPACHHHALPHLPSLLQGVPYYLSCTDFRKWLCLCLGGLAMPGTVERSLPHACACPGQFGGLQPGPWNPTVGTCLPPG